ncbi:MAG: YncE family protein, partial [Nitrosotalea sp.]
MNRKIGIISISAVLFCLLFTQTANAITVVATVPVGLGPVSVAYDSGKDEIFVANFASNSVSVISDATNTVVATLSVGSNPEGVAYDSGKDEIFVANTGSNSVSVISDATNTVVATLSVGSAPLSVAYDSGKDEIFV